MTTSGRDEGSGKRKVRVPFRRNRARPARRKDWTRLAHEEEGGTVDGAASGERVVARGEHSRQRTIVVRDDGTAARGPTRPGVVIAVKGLYADVEVSGRIVPCTVRRVLRTRLIAERHPVTVGDRVHVSVEEKTGSMVEGVVEAVEPRRGELRRKTGRRIHTVAANIDQAVIVSSAWEPMPKPELIDRYIIACLSGGITPILCMNKIDLDLSGGADLVLERYTKLPYRILRTSVVTGAGVAELRAVLRDRVSVIAGQSGVGKSSLLNAVQPGLALAVGAVAEHNEKGRHTTTTAVMIPLAQGGYVVDTPGVRTFDISMIPRHEFEACFEEFVPFVETCRFPDCTHSHEEGCAVKEAVEGGLIHPGRYESYLHVFTDPGIE